MSSSSHPSRVVSRPGRIKSSTLFSPETHHSALENVLDLSYYENIRSSPSWEAEVAAKRSHVIRFSRDAANSPQSYRICNLASFHALTGGEARKFRHDSVDEVAAILLAIYHFNNGNDAVVPELRDIHKKCDVRLTADIFNSNYSPTETVRALLSVDVLKREHAASTPLPCGVLGLWRSAVAIPLSTTAASFWGNGVGSHGNIGSYAGGGIPVVSYASTSTALDNKDEHPLFGRTITSTDGLTRVLVQYLRENLNVRQAAVLYVKDPWGVSFRRSFADAAREAGMLDVRAEAIAYNIAEAQTQDVRLALKRIKRRGYKYLVCAFFNPQVLPVLKEALSVGMVGRDSQTHWTFAELDTGMFLNDTLNENSTDLSSISSLAFFQGTGGVPQLIPDKRSSYNRFLDEWTTMEANSKFVHYLQEKLPRNITDKIVQDLIGKSPKSPWAAYAYDAAIAHGFAACNALDVVSESKNDQKKGFFSGPELYKAFLHGSFGGASGTVAIDNKTGTRDYRSAVFTLDNVLANDPNPSGRVTFRIEPSMVYIDNTWKVREDGNKFVFGDGTTQHPSSVPHMEHNMNLIGTAGLAIGYAWCCIMLATAIYFASWTWWHRTMRVVQSSQPTFMYLIALGAVISALTIVPLSMQEPIPQRGLDISCMAVPWLSAVGFTTAFSALFAKSLRVNRLMLHRGLRKIKVGRRHVIKPFITLVTTNVLILSSWTALAPLQWERTPGTTLDIYSQPTDSFGSCTLPQHGTTSRWVAVLHLSMLIAVDFVAIAVAVYQAYRGRQIDTEFSESQFVGLSILAMLQASLLGLPLFFATEKSPPARFVVSSTLIFVAAETILLLMFVPKIHFLRMWRQKEIKRKQSMLRKTKTPIWMINRLHSHVPKHHQDARPCHADVEECNPSVSRTDPEAKSTIAEAPTEDELLTEVSLSSCEMRIHFRKKRTVVCVSPHKSEVHGSLNSSAKDLLRSLLRKQRAEARSSPHESEVQYGSESSVENLFRSQPSKQRAVARLSPVEYEVQGTSDSSVEDSFRKQVRKQRAVARLSPQEMELQDASGDSLKELSKKQLARKSISSAVNHNGITICESTSENNEGQGKNSVRFSMLANA
mmetsp:Transcript_6205/g.18093  ORF Transcript_6205/g.18093 Transcript_6205/m.18093 type:complete len:1105 (-) Transcript_6205:68-3382(-)